MKTQKNIFIAFILNLFFSVFEFFGGIFTGSVAIISDALHDLGDAASIGISWLLEKKSRKAPDENFTYGYGRWSVIGAALTTVILLLGSALVLYNSFLRIIEPKEINYEGMIVFALVGVAVNALAAFVTGKGESINQKAVNLHMLEDVLGWCVVLIGAVIMHFTDFYIIDPIMSAGVSLFIAYGAVKNLFEVLNVFLEKVPTDISVKKVREHLCEIEGVIDVHHIHIWSIDGESSYATMHIVTDCAGCDIKEKIRHELEHLGICHSTLELEAKNESCSDKECAVRLSERKAHHHHHGHHH